MQDLDDLFEKMGLFGEALERLGLQLKFLFSPYAELLEYIQDDILALSAFIVDGSARNRLLVNQQKEYRKYMANKCRVQYKQFALVKTIPRNLPYQRRIY